MPGLMPLTRDAAKHWLCPQGDDHIIKEKNINQRITNTFKILLVTIGVDWEITGGFNPTRKVRQDFTEEGMLY